MTVLDERECRASASSDCEKTFIPETTKQVMCKACSAAMKAKRSVYALPEEEKPMGTLIEFRSKKRGIPRE